MEPLSDEKFFEEFGGKNKQRLVDLARECGTSESFILSLPYSLDDDQREFAERFWLVAQKRW